jgi:hypothetical protein
MADALHSLTASISVNPRNTMEGQFAIQGSASGDLPASINPRIGKTILASVTVYAQTSTDFPGSIHPRLCNHVTASINPVATSFLPAVIGVSPQARMEGIIDVTPPPYYIVQNLPTIDTCVNQANPTMNYGMEKQVILGNFDGEVFRTLYKFGTEGIPLEDINILRAEIRLTNIYSPAPVTVEVYEAAEEWAEYGTTWANRPALGPKLGEITLQGTNTETSFSVLPLMTRWLSGDNNGLVFKALDESGGYSLLTTRESLSLNPILEVEYKSTTIKSYGSSKRPASITVRSASGLDLPANIKVDSHHIHYEFHASIVVPSYNGTSEITASIEASKRRFKELPGSILVPIYPGSDDLAASIELKYRDYLPSTITVPIYDMVEDFSASITAKAKGKSELATSILVPIYDRIQDLPASIFIVAYGESSLPSAITVPIYDGVKNLSANIFSRVRRYSSITASINVPIYDALLDLTADINPRLFSSIVGSITPKAIGFDDLSSNISPRSANFLPASILVRSGFLAAGISVRLSEERDIPGSIRVQVRRKNDLSATIVFGTWGPGWSDFPASIEPILRKDATADFAAYIGVSGSGGYVFIM